jgi:transposase
MKRDLKALQRRRLRAARLLAEGVAKAEVARRLGVSRQSVSRGAKRMADGGETALKGAVVGRPSQLDAEARRELVRLLKQGALAAGFSTELWTLPRIKVLIAKHLGPQYSEAHLSRLVKGLGFSCQRPTGRAIQRDQKAIRQWKTRRWPALKKTPKNAGKR